MYEANAANFVQAPFKYIHNAMAHILLTLKHDTLINELLLMQFYLCNICLKLHHWKWEKLRVTLPVNMAPFSKEDKTFCLYERKGYNARQFITEFLNKGWTKNSINRL